MRFMPWIQMSKKAAPAAKTVALDYNSMLAPVVIFASMRNRHFLVTVSATVALILKLLIALASGLLVLQIIPLEMKDVPFTVRESFVPRVEFSHIQWQIAVPSKVVRDQVGPTKTHSEPDIIIPRTPDGLLPKHNVVFRTWRDFLYLNMTAPSGYSRSVSTGRGVAYQDIVVMPDSQDSSIEIIVDGVWSDLDCSNASLASVTEGRHFTRSGLDYPNVNLTFNSKYCENPVKLMRLFTISPDRDTELYHLESYFGPGKTSYLRDDEEAVPESAVCTGAGGPVLMYGQLHANRWGMYNITYESASAVFCQPKYMLGKAKLLYPGPQVEIQPQLGSQSVIGDYTFAMLSSYTESLVQNNYSVLGLDQVDVPGNINQRLQFAEQVVHGLQSTGEQASLFTALSPDDMIKGLTAFYQQYPSLWAHFMLRQSGNSTTLGSMVQRPNRLVLNSFIGHLIATLLLGSILILAAAGLVLVPGHSFIPQDTETILGAFVTIVNNQTSLRKLSGSILGTPQSIPRYQTTCSGAQLPTWVPHRPKFTIDVCMTGPDGDMQVLGRKDRARYRPVVLETWSRTLISLTVVGLILSIISFYVSPFGRMA